MMYDRENDNRINNEGQQVQQELEDQLRAFGDTVSDAFAHGFEGKGMDIGDRVWDVGKAAVHAANFGISEAGKALRNSRNEYYKAQQEAQKTGPRNAGGMPQWARQIFGLKGEQTPVDLLRADGKKRQNGGAALLAVGITFMVIFGITGISCLAVAGSVTPIFMNSLAMYTFAGELLSSAAYTALNVCGAVFTLIACGFGWMIAAGASRLAASKKLRLLADAAEGMDYRKGLSVEMLADLTHQKKAKALKKLRKYIRKEWLAAWLDEKTETLYLTIEDYRAAQQLQQPAAEKTEEEAEQDTAPISLETARRFAAVLEQEKQFMRDEQGREELKHMQKTAAAICDWLEVHPESLPKTRRFAEYYIPTTLKLLHTYNDVQGQQGENAETIRRDIAGILHTLNQAYDTLYDTLLSDVAMDVSSEIAALQGMLANDGLTGGDFQ